MLPVNLPEPASWAKTGKLSIWLRLAVVVAVLYVIGRGVVAVVQGSYLTAAVWFGTFAPPVFLLSVLALGPQWGAKARTTSDGAGFTVWPSRVFSALYFATLALIVPFALAFAILLSRGMIDISVPRGLQIVMPVAFSAVALVATGGLIAGVRRRGVGYLKFTPALVEIADALRTTVLEWDDVIDVTDHSTAKNAKRSGRSVVLCLHDGSEVVIGALNLYVPTGVPLYWLVRHYWRHPEDRPELTTPRASERLREGQFDLS